MSMGDSEQHDNSKEEVEMQNQCEANQTLFIATMRTISIINICCCYIVTIAIIITEAFLLLLSHLKHHGVPGPEDTP